MRLYALGLAAAPSLVLTAAFALSTGSTQATNTFGWDTAAWKLLAGLLSLTWGLASFDPRELAVCLLLALLVWLLIAIALRARLPKRHLHTGDAFALAALLSITPWRRASVQIQCCSNSTSGKTSAPATWRGPASSFPWATNRAGLPRSGTEST